MGTEKKLVVYYRLCSIKSTNPSPIYQDNKFELNKLCFKSFVEAFKDIKPKVVVLADYCGFEEADMIDELCPFEYEFKPTKLGINETCLLQYELASKQPEDLILFLECDYLWNPNADVRQYISAIEKLGLVSPYDHLNYYLDKNAHSNTCQIELVDNHHFRTVETCTMTFGLRKDVLVDNIDIFNKYGYLDHDVWYDLRQFSSQELYVPIPTFATHMVIDYLSPTVKWGELYDF